MLFQLKRDFGHTTTVNFIPILSHLNQLKPFLGFYVVCEELSMSTCAGHVSYSRTSFPNWLGHMSQSETAKHVEGTWKLALSSGCSPLAPPFVCATYAPKCSGKMIP